MADGDFDGTDEERYHTPKSKGGRRKSLENLKPWRPGQSGNPSGMTKSVLEIQRMCRDLTPDVIMVMNKIVHDEKAANRDRIMAGQIIKETGCGKPPVSLYTGGSDLTGLDIAPEEGYAVSALLARARLSQKKPQ